MSGDTSAIPAQPALSVVLVDDHPVFREGLRFTLEQAPDLTVVAEASDGRTGVGAVREHDPDVVLMDLQMPVLGGLAATRLLSEEGCRGRVLVLTMYDDDANVLAAMRAGASGYLVKGAEPEQVISAVRAVASGHAVFGAPLAARMLEVFRAGGGSDASAVPRPGGGFAELSRREKEVLEYLAQGLTNQQIGAALFISPVTVRNHVSSILGKLQLTDRRQVMLRARRSGTT